MVARFLGASGMGHPSEDVARRAAYLFSRLSKQLRGPLRPLVPEILKVSQGSQRVPAWAWSLGACALG